MLQTLQDAIQAIQSGDKAAGKKILGQLLRANPNNELAWLWMTECVEQDAQRIYCFEQALKINPKNVTARQGLERLKGSSTQPPRPETSSQVPPEQSPARRLPSQPRQIPSSEQPVFDASLYSASTPAPDYQEKKRSYLLITTVIPVFLLLLLAAGWFVLTHQRQGRFSGHEVGGTFWGAEEDSDFILGGTFSAQAGEEVVIEYDVDIQSDEIAIYLRPMFLFWQKPGNQKERAPILSTYARPGRDSFRSSWEKAAGTASRWMA